MPCYYGAGVLGPALLAVVAIPALAATEDTEARALFQRVLESVPGKPFVGKVVLTTGGDRKREATISHKKLADGSLAVLIEATSPTDVKDTRFLFIDRPDGTDEQYIYVPKMRRVRRLGGNLDNQPFLGSEFTVSEFVDANPDDYTMTFVGDTTIDGRKCRLVEAKKKDPTAWSYGRAVYAIDPADLLVLRIEFFDRTDKPIKLWTLERVEKIEGVWTPRLTRAKDLENDVESTLEVIELSFNVDLPDSRFSRSALER